MKTLLRALAVAAAVLVAAGGALYWTLRPPPALELPQQGFLL